jgi:signal peptidase I
MKLFKKIASIFFSILLFILLPIVVGTLITSRWATPIGIRSFTVLSGSMQPTLPIGSVIYTYHQNWYDIGSIIAFKSSGTTVTHRVVNIQNINNVIYYETQGDANNTKDGHLVEAKAVIGKEAISIPYLGRAIVFIQSPVGFFSLIIFPVVFFLFCVVFLGGHTNQ